MEPPGIPLDGPRPTTAVKWRDYGTPGQLSPKKQKANKVNIQTLLQGKFLADQADKLFERAAQAWVQGHNSGKNESLIRFENKCRELRRKAEVLLEPLGIEVDYPGLYPSFKVNGFEYHSTFSAVSAAMEVA